MEVFRFAKRVIESLLATQKSQCRNEVMYRIAKNLQNFSPSKERKRGQFILSSHLSAASIFLVMESIIEMITKSKIYPEA